jgi:hypothetical protein
VVRSLRTRVVLAAVLLAIYVGVVVLIGKWTDVSPIALVLVGLGALAGVTLAKSLGAVKSRR